jgi:hypothetical protein
LVDDHIFCDLGFGEIFLKPIDLHQNDDPCVNIINKDEIYYITEKTSGRIFLRFTKHKKTIEELINSSVWYPSEKGSLWDIWTTRLYESRIIERNGAHQYAIRISIK